MAWSDQLGRPTHCCPTKYASLRTLHRTENAVVEHPENSQNTQGSMSAIGKDGPPGCKYCREPLRFQFMPDFSPELLAYGFVWYVAFLFSTTCHEAAHALVAKLGGDETAALGGQVTLNPVPHIQLGPPAP